MEAALHKRAPKGAVSESSFLRMLLEGLSDICAAIHSTVTMTSGDRFFEMQKLFKGKLLHIT